MAVSIRKGVKCSIRPWSPELPVYRKVLDLFSFLHTQGFTPCCGCSGLTLGYSNDRHNVSSLRALPSWPHNYRHHKKTTVNVTGVLTEKAGALLENMKREGVRFRLVPLRRNFTLAKTQRDEGTFLLCVAGQGGGGGNGLHEGQSARDYGMFWKLNGFYCWSEVSRTERNTRFPTSNTADILSQVPLCDRDRLVPSL